MRNSLRKALLLALASLLLAGLAACGGSDGDSSDSSKSASKNISGKITVWDVNYKAWAGYTKAIDQLKADFEKAHPGVTVEHIPQPLKTYDQVLQASFTGRRGPEVMQLFAGQRGALRWTKGLLPLEDRITDDMRKNLTGWDGVTPGFENDGDNRCLPRGMQSVVFYYNKKLFAKAGLPADFRPESWKDVQAAGEKLKAAGIQPFTGGNKEGLENANWMSAAFATLATPEQAVDFALGKTPYTDELFTRVLEVHLAMNKAGLFESDRFTTPLFPDGAARFGEGKSGMLLGLWSLGSYYNDYIPKLGVENLGLFLPPGQNYQQLGTAGCWAIPAFGKNKDAAWAYLEFLTSQHGVNTLYTVGGILPNRRDVKVAADAPPQERELIDASRVSETGPLFQNMLPAQVDAAVNKEMNEVLQGRKSLSAAQKAIQAAADQVAN